MVQFPSEYKEEIKKQIMDDGRKKRVKIHWKNESIPNLDNASIKQESMTFTESINSNGEFKYGGGELCVLEFTAYGLPNVKGEIFEAVVEYILDGEFDIHLDRTNIYYDSIIDKYIATIPLGTYRVDECKKTGSNGLNERKILAYTDETVNPTLVTQFDVSNNNVNILEPNIFLKANSFLAIQDNVSNQSIETITKSSFKEEQAFYTPSLGTINGYKYSLVFQIKYMPEYSQALRGNMCMVNRGLGNIGFDYERDNTVRWINLLCQNEGIYPDTINERSEIAKKIKEIFDIAKSIVRNDELIYNFGYADKSINNIFPYHLLPWYSVTVELYRNHTLVDSGISNYAGSESTTGLVRINANGIGSNANFLIEKPKVKEYEKWTTNFRKSFYELEGLIAQARNNFHPINLITTGLVPHKGLYPHDLLFPSESLVIKTNNDSSDDDVITISDDVVTLNDDDVSVIDDDDIVVDDDNTIGSIGGSDSVFITSNSSSNRKGYVESKDIKNLFVDEDKKKYGNIVFEWNNQAGNSQKFTWKMPTNETLNNLNEIRVRQLTVSRKDEEKKIVFTFDAITNNICYLSVHLPSKSNMTLMSLTPTDYFVIEAYADDKKLFEIVNNKENYASGSMDVEYRFYEHDYRIQKGIYEDSYWFRGKFTNDACVGMNKIIIRTNENAVFPTQQIQPISINDYVIDDRCPIEYIDGDTYVIDTSNLILDKGNLNGYALMYYVMKYDALLRNLDYAIVDADIKAMPHLEAGDMIEFHSPYANAKTIVMRRTMQGIQSLTDNIEAN